MTQIEPYLLMFKAVKGDTLRTLKALIKGRPLLARMHLELALISLVKILTINHLTVPIVPLEHLTKWEEMLLKRSGDLFIASMPELMKLAKARTKLAKRIVAKSAKTSLTIGAREKRATSLLLTLWLHTKGPLI